MKATEHTDLERAETRTKSAAVKRKARSAAPASADADVSEERVVIRGTPSLSRKYRRAEERPRPDLAPDAPANRLRPHVALTLPPDLIEELNAEAHRLGVGRSALIETAVRRFLGSKKPYIRD